VRPAPMDLLGKLHAIHGARHVNITHKAAEVSMTAIRSRTPFTDPGSCFGSAFGSKDHQT
jgi:hypothetical protein